MGPTIQPTNKETKAKLLANVETIFSRWEKGDSIYVIAKDLDVNFQTLKYFIRHSKVAKERGKKLFKKEDV